MTDEEKEVIERINSFKSIKVLYGKIYAMHTEQLEQLQKDIKVVLNLIKKQQTEINKYKEMLAVSIADRVNSAFKQKYKNDEDLEMLYKGCQIELEEKDKIIDRMADFMWDYDCCSNFPQEYCKDCCDLGQGKQCIKEYFKKKVEG